MARQALQDRENRTVVIERTRLLAQLRSNLEEHLGNYRMAVSGYKAQLQMKLEDTILKARQTLEKSYEKQLRKLETLDEADIHRQDEYIRVMDAVFIEMPVPRSHAAEYEAVIAMVEWDTREELELTMPEFECFIRDNWDWQHDFRKVTEFYSK